MVVPQALYGVSQVYDNFSSIKCRMTAAMAKELGTRNAQPLGGQWSGWCGLAPSLEGNQKVTASGLSYWEHSIAQTLDDNVTWTALNTNYGPSDLARDPQWEERLYAANNNGDTAHGDVIVSYDGGLSWSEYALGWTNSIAVVAK